MPLELKVPAVGESVQEVQIGQWMVKEGDRVEKDQNLVEIETDKASLELPAPAAGVLTRIVKQQGEPAEVGEVIGLLEAKINEGAAATGTQPNEPRQTPQEEVDPGRAAAAQSDRAKREPSTATQDVAAKRDKKLGKQEKKARKEEKKAKRDDEHMKTRDAAAKVAPERRRTEWKEPAGESKDGFLAPEQQPAVTPAARRMLREHGLTAQQFSAQGRVTRDDVLAFVKKHPAESDDKRGQGEDSQSSPDAAQPVPSREEKAVPMSLLRKRIARRLVEAQQTAAILTTFNEIDMSAVMDLRREHKQHFHETYGVKLGIMSFFVKASVEALQEFPAVNAEIRDDKIVYKSYYDIGVAIGGGKGLVVPVLRDAQSMSFAQIEKAIAEFAKRAESGDLKPEELEGGTFTISNGGVYGSLLSTPILNPPQSGILGLHAIQDRPIARDGQVVIRPMMYAALSYDHRLVDGREAVSFLRRIKETIEEPVRVMLEI